ncbi:MAG TPA: TIGR03118 family protein [Tepidisphaeraceae bacterium]|jgi:uncharacterized protein (TIGR03118 family)|nr:TIGR03118 family protein [Tepidisphaeraceae bacterium]
MSATVFDQTNLVSDQFGVAQIQDKHLINPWGIALNPAAGAFWIADNDAGVATLYTGDVKNSSLAKAPLVVSIPNGEATGIVNNTTMDFVVKDKAGHSAPAVFIFASEDGNISGWNPTVPPPAPSTHAQPATHVNGAFFTGLGIASAGGKNFIYAADFAGGKIDVFDAQFHKTTLSGSFTDSHIPKGFSPHNIQNLGGNLFVTYAQHDPAHPDREVFGAGKGFVDEFDTSGHLIRRIASGGSLNAPWGLALAPKNFGSFGGDLLVGNLGDGHITAFDPTRNFNSEGQLKNASGHTIAIQDLWGLQFGNGLSSGDTNALYFTAGSGHYQHGLFGSIRIARDITTSTADDHGHADLFVKGTGDADQLSISEDVNAKTTTLVTDGRTQVFDHLFSQINIQLKGKHSHMTLDLPGTTTLSINEA